MQRFSVIRGNGNRDADTNDYVQDRRNYDYVAPHVLGRHDDRDGNRDERRVASCYLLVHCNGQGRYSAYDCYAGGEHDG